MTSTRSCPHCAGPLVKKPGPGRWPKYCSEECRRQATRPTPAAVSLACGQCGEAFTGKQGQKYCSPKCRDRAHYLRAREDGRYDAWLQQTRQKEAGRRAELKCPYCDEPMPPRRRSHCGASECERQNTNRRMREFMRRYQAENGVSYARKYRSPEQDAARFAALRRWAEENPEEAAARKQEAWQRRRARKRQAPYETFRHEDVYERDDWVCQLCSIPVDPKAKHPDPMSASLDHVVPFARGGHHVWDNVQLAHLRCNVRKQARLDWTPEEAS